MVDEPSDVASMRRVSGAGVQLPVAQGARLGPLVDVSRLSAVVSPRLWAYVGQSAGEGRWPLCSVSGVWAVVRGGRGSYNLVRTVTYSPPDAPEGYPRRRRSEAPRVVSWGHICEIVAGLSGAD